jgi:glycosyltransferase involved in cell wall biosynthesis
LLGARLADEVIVVSEHLGDKLGRSDYHVIPSGIDLELFRPIDRLRARRQIGWSGEGRYVLFVANPDKPIKRHWLAHRAVEAAQNAFTEDKPELVVVQGKPPEAIPVYMSAADALVLTSISEGSPNVVKEALACNLPVVSVDVGDVRERVSGVDGCIVCQDDLPQTIAAGIIQVLRDEGRIAGRSAVLCLDGRLMAEKTLAVYRRAIQGQGAEA